VEVAQLRQIADRQTELPEQAPPQEHCFAIPVNFIPALAFSLTVAEQTQAAPLLWCGLSLVFIYVEEGHPHMLIILDEAA
jgi:hypothetical protein